VDVLAEHLRAWLGAWPPTGPLTVTTAAGRVEPGWDGIVHPVFGVEDATGAVVSVPPGVLHEADQMAAQGGFDALARGLGPLLGRPGDALQAGVFRWTMDPTPATVLPDAGTWRSLDEPLVPEWLHPFGSEILIATVDGVYASGVGLKRHDDYGWELAVGTDPPFTGRGLARRLVAQAARRVIDEGRVATYLHDPANVASARVAEAAGFPDRGWKVLGLWPAGPD